MLRKLLPKEHRFFNLFQDQANAIRQGLDLFELLLSDYTRRGELAKQIKAAENRADDIAHEIFQLLNNTFVTPFDREDIQLLVNRMDDVMDMVEKASARLEIYDVPSAPPAVSEMLRILKKAFLDLSEAVGLLRDWKQRDRILRICVEVNRLENEDDALLRGSLSRLFKEASDPFYLIKVKEIYESLEEAIDRCEDLANILETILMKNA